ncbi:MAG: hypothetical protein K9G69_04635 [Candidatus Nanopelagicales bacterium]|nr:hypothetical protein [Candidatus Nanopelagicales bacterium]
MRIADQQRGRLILGLSWKEHVGGRWAVSLLAYLVNLPINILSIVVNARETPGSSDIAMWFVVSLIGYASLGIVLLAANFSVLRNRRTVPVPIWVVIAVGAVAGGVRGAVVGNLAEIWELPVAGQDAILVRALTGVGLGAVGIPLAALFLSIVSTYLFQRRQLVEEQSRLEVVRMQADGISDRLRSEVLAHVQGDLQEVVDTQDPDLARNLSRKIWEEPTMENQQPRLHIRHVLHTSITTNNYSTWPVALIWTLSAWGALSLAQGWLSAVVQITFTLTGLWLIFTAARRLTQRHAHHALLIFVTANIAIIAVSGPIAWAIFDRREIADSLNLILINAMWFPLVVILVAVVSGAVRSSEEVLTRLQENLNHEEIKVLAAQHESDRIHREIATLLHGSVQTRLLTSAALMRQPELIKKWGLQFPEQLLADMDLSTFDSESHLPFHDRVQAITRPWSVLMDVRVTTNVNGLSISVQDAVCQVLEEALSNAYRHGNATQVDCVIDHTQDTVTVVVTDNGDGTAGDGAYEGSAPGLGSALLGLHTENNWSLSARPTGGSTLRAVISCAEGG